MSVFLNKRRLRKNRVVDRRHRQQRFFFGLSIYLVIGAFAAIVLSGPSVRSPESAGTSNVSGTNGIAEIQNLLGPDSPPHPGGSSVRPREARRRDLADRSAGHLRARTP